MRYILGIDAGFSATGLILFEYSCQEGLLYRSSDTIKTEKQSAKKNMRVADDDVLRTWMLIDGVERFLSDISGSDHLYIAAELPTGGAQGARANRAMGIATGAVVGYLRAKCVGSNWTTEYVTPMQVKIAATGMKSASKDQMMEWFKGELAESIIGVGDWPKSTMEHIADAYGAIAHVWTNSEMFKMFLSNA